MSYHIPVVMISTLDSVCIRTITSLEVPNHGERGFIPQVTGPRILTEELW